MNKLTFIFLILSLQSFSYAEAETITGSVVRVSDGDTVVVLDTNKVQHKIRLMGIDAPEKKQAYGRKSKDNLSSLIAGKHVVVEYKKRDQYKRIIGKIKLSGKDVNLEQVEAGMALHYKQYQGEQSRLDRQLYSEAEDGARNAKRGLWYDPNPIPPWDYRRIKKPK